MKFSTATALLAVLAPYGANSQCAYMNEKNKQQRRLGEQEIDERKLQANHFYGKLTDLPPFDAANAFRFIEASTKGGYMDESIRATGRRDPNPNMLMNRDGTVSSISVAGRTEAVSYCLYDFVFV